MIKAITTEYAGRRFRSRTEARWAVFFDTLGIKWEYEVEGYELPSGRYLPDFWLPKEKMWAEVKGKEFTPEEIRKCTELTDATGFYCLMLDGQPNARFFWATSPIDHEPFIDFNLSQFPHYGRFFCASGNVYPEVEDQTYDCDGVRVALSARFEFGENRK